MRPFHPLRRSTGRPSGERSYSWKGARIEHPDARATPGAGVGVDATADQSSIDDWTEVGSEDNVRDDLPVMVRANGIPIQLVRDHGTMVALADRCTHRGGPLHEGTVQDGCVTYPARQPVPARRRRGRPRASHAITAAVRRSGQRWADPGAPGRSGRFAED